MNLTVSQLQAMFGNDFTFDENVSCAEIQEPLQYAPNEYTNHLKNCEEKTFVEILNTNQLQIYLFNAWYNNQYVVETPNEELQDIVMDRLSTIITQQGVSFLFQDTKIDIKKLSSLLNLLNLLVADSLTDPTSSFQHIIIDKAFVCTKTKLSFKTKKDSRNSIDFTQTIQQLNQNLNHVFEFLNFIDNQLTFRPTLTIVNPKDLWYLLWCDFDVVKRFNIVYALYNNKLDEIFALEEHEELLSILDKTVFQSVRDELSDEVIQSHWQTKAFDSTIGALISQAVVNHNSDNKFNAIIKLNEWLDLQHRSSYLNLTVRERQNLSKNHIQNLLSEQIKMRYNPTFWDLFLGNNKHKINGQEYHNKMIELNLPMYRVIMNLLNSFKLEKQEHSNNELWLDNNVIQVIQKESEYDKLSIYSFIEILRLMLIS